MRLLLQRTINAPEDFTFGAAEKEATIRELREEIRIVRSRMENNPEVKRYAGALRGSESQACPHASILHETCLRIRKGVSMQQPAYRRHPASAVN